MNLFAVMCGANARRTLVRSAASLVLGLACVQLDAQARAQSGAYVGEGVPQELQGIDIEEKPNAQVPLDATFVDEDGNEIRFGDLLGRGKPVILQIGYLKCPMLCNLVLNGVVDSMKGVDWSAGDKFEVISVSLSPRETHELAKVKRDAYVLSYERPGTTRGFHFLTGPEASSAAIADSVGFRYRIQSNGEIAHAAAIFVLTPDGRVSRYMYGTSFRPGDLRMALLEASEGKIGTTLDRFILWCHVYDPNARGYVLFAMRLMQLGGVVTLVLLGSGLGWFWWKEARRRRDAVDADATREPSTAPHAH